MFFRKKKEIRTYDRDRQKPVLHKSICTGETTGGLKDLATGTIHDVMLIRNEKELKEFMEMYGLEAVPETEY